jgi:hypothetical protein
MTLSPGTAFPLASVTVAVASVVDAPSATIDGGESVTLTVLAGPGVWVSVAWPLIPAVESSAVMVDWPALVVLVIVAV